jgi:hypothetical protein
MVKPMSSVFQPFSPNCICRAKGGKIVYYHGWADTALTPLMTINYYESVLKLMGETRRVLCVSHQLVVCAKVSALRPGSRHVDD